MIDGTIYTLTLSQEKEVRLITSGGLTNDDLEFVFLWLKRLDLRKRDGDKESQTETVSVSAETVKATQVAKSPAKNRNGSKPKAAPIAAVTVVAPEPVVEVELEPPAGKKRSQTETILAYLSEKGSSTVNHIAAGTGIPKSSVSAWVSVLLRKGNIQVAGNTLHDGRTIKTYAMNENGHEEAITE